MFPRLLAFSVALVCSVPAMATEALKVLSLNIEAAGLHRGVALDETIAVLRAADADIIGLQEVFRFRTDCASEACVEANGSLASEIAGLIGYHVVEQPRRPTFDGFNAVLSRHPVAVSAHSSHGVRVVTPHGPVIVFNLHLPNAPYQPYQLVGIPYADAPFLTTAAAAQAAASEARGAIIGEIEQEVAVLQGKPAIILGDFNEPSHRDWTPRAAALGLVPVAVAWPTTRRIEAMDFVDVWRNVHPDEVMHPGDTWTTRASPRERHDRIDFIFARGPGLEIVSAAVIGEPSAASDVVVSPWPSDHRGVLATLRFGGEGARVARAQR